MKKHIEAVKKAVSKVNIEGVELVENGLGGFITISLENSWIEAYDFLERLELSDKYWVEPYSSCEILVGLE